MDALIYVIVVSLTFSGVILVGASGLAAAEREHGIQATLGGIGLMLHILALLVMP